MGGDPLWQLLLTFQIMSSASGSASEIKKVPQKRMAHPTSGVTTKPTADQKPTTSGADKLKAKHGRK